MRVCLSADGSHSATLPTMRRAIAAEQACGGSRQPVGRAGRYEQLFAPSYLLL